MEVIDFMLVLQILFFEPGHFASPKLSVHVLDFVFQVKITDIFCGNKFYNLFNFLITTLSKVK